MKPLKLLPLLFVLFTVAHLQAQDQNVLKFKIEGLSCFRCANSAQNALNNIKGVDSAHVDFDSKKAIVYASGDVNEEKVKTTISDMNFQALFGEERLLKPLTEKERKRLDIKTIKGGKNINFSKHLSEDKLTIFDFYADWCGPCKVYSPKLENLLLTNKDIALRKVDLVNWDSNLARQLTKDYQLPSLPFTLIFNDKGELVGKVEGNNIGAVEAILNKK